MEEDNTGQGGERAADITVYSCSAGSRDRRSMQCAKGKGWQSDRRAQGLEVGVLEPSRAKSLKEGRGRKPAESGPCRLK